MSMRRSIIASRVIVWSFCRAVTATSCSPACKGQAGAFGVEVDAVERLGDRVVQLARQATALSGRGLVSSVLRQLLLDPFAVGDVTVATAPSQVVAGGVVDRLANVLEPALLSGLGDNRNSRGNSLLPSRDSWPR